MRHPYALASLLYLHSLDAPRFGLGAHVTPKWTLNPPRQALGLTEAQCGEAIRRAEVHSLIYQRSLESADSQGAGRHPAGS